MALGWLCFILGITLKRLAGIETMFVLQFSWLNVLCTNNTFILPFKSLYPLKYTTFHNIPIISEPNSNEMLQPAPYVS